MRNAGSKIDSRSHFFPHGQVFGVKSQAVFKNIIQDGHLESFHPDFVLKCKQIFWGSCCWSHGKRRRLQLQVLFSSFISSLGSLFPFGVVQNPGNVHSRAQAFLEPAPLAALPGPRVDLAGLLLGALKALVGGALNGASEEGPAAVAHLTAVIAVTTGRVATHLANFLAVCEGN